MNLLSSISLFNALVLTNIGGIFPTTVKKTYNAISESKIKKTRIRPTYYTDDTNAFFNINSFIVENIGVNNADTFSLSYRAFRLNYKYYIEYSYSYIDSNYVLGAESYFETIKNDDLNDRNLAFKVDGTKFSIPYVSFEIYIKCYKSENSINKTYSEQRIRFSLVNAKHEVVSLTPSCELPYRFSYDGSTYIATTSIDLLIFGNYQRCYTDELYFRIKPSKFIFTYYGPNNLADVEFIIYNNNGSFSDSLNRLDSGKPFFLLKQVLIKNNNFTLGLKNIENGGNSDLFLNPVTGLMSKNKSKGTYLKVNNIYLPREKTYKYSLLKCGIKIREFGHSSMSVLWNFEMIFSSNIFDFYFNKMRPGKVIDDPTMDEVTVL